MNDIRNKEAQKKTSKINLLPSILANQIAAGEVIERPASVVKELVENAVDAGATSIDIDIERGGVRQIRVRDNGAGITKADLPLAITAHATSKIVNVDDLEHIKTLGFRGEALASIGSVSRLSLQSKPHDQELAWQVHTEGKDMRPSLQPVAHNDGTTVLVKDLFFNTPARRKFLRAERTEFGHIDLLVKRLALSAHAVSFRLRHNDKLIRDCTRATEHKGIERRIAQFYGKAFIDNAVFFEREAIGLRLWGWLGVPSHYRTLSDQQCFFVNGRLVKDRLISHAVRQAYENMLPSEHYPTYVIYFELPADMVDVNVHPTKHEVRFRDMRLIHDFIHSSLKQAMLKATERQAKLAPRLSPIPVQSSPLSERQSMPQDDEHALEIAKPPSSTLTSSTVRQSLGGRTPPRIFTRSSFAAEPATTEAENVTADESEILGVINEHTAVSYNEKSNALHVVNILKGLTFKHADELTTELNTNGCIGYKPLLFPERKKIDGSLPNSLWSFLKTLGVQIQFREPHTVVLMALPSQLEGCDNSIFFNVLLKLCQQHNKLTSEVVIKLMARFIAQSQLKLSKTDASFDEFFAWHNSQSDDQQKRYTLILEDDQLP